MQAKYLTNLLDKYWHSTSDTTRFIGRAGATFFVIVSGTGLGMLLRSVLARQMAAEQFGYYSYAISSSIVLMQLAGLGLATSTLRIVPRYLADGHRSLLNGFFKTSSLSILVASLIITISMLALISLRRDALAADFVFVLLLLCVQLVLDVFLTQVSRVVLAFKHVVAAQVPASIVRTVVQSAAILVIYFRFQTTLSAPYVMFAYLVGTAVSLLLIWIFFRRLVPASRQRNRAEYDLTSWFRTTTPIFGQDVLRIIVSQFDILALGIFVGTTQAGIYSMVILISSTILFGITAVNQILAPRFSEAFSRGDMIELQRQVTLGTVISTIYALVVFAGIIVVGPIFLGFLGKEFLSGYVPLLIISFSLVVNAAAGSVGFLMNMTKLEKGHLTLLAASAAISLLLNFTLTPTFGMNGAALASALSMIFLQLSSVWYIWRSLKIKTTLLQLVL